MAEILAWFWLSRGLSNQCVLLGVEKKRPNGHIRIIQNLLTKSVANRAFMYQTWFAFDWICAALSENTVLNSSVSAFSITSISTSSTNFKVPSQSETLCHPSSTVQGVGDGPVYIPLFCHALQSSPLSVPFKLKWLDTLFQDCLCFLMPESHLFFFSGALQFMICTDEGITNTRNSRPEWEIADFLHVK